MAKNETHYSITWISVQIGSLLSEDPNISFHIGLILLVSIIMTGPPPLKLIQLEQGLRIIIRNQVVLFIPSRSVSLCLVSHSWSVLEATSSHLFWGPPYSRAHSQLLSWAAATTLTRSQKKSPTNSPKLAALLFITSDSCDRMPTSH